jgi:hypothetical protein
MQAYNVTLRSVTLNDTILATLVNDDKAQYEPHIDPLHACKLSYRLGSHALHA